MTEKSQSFREVVVWQKAHAFTLAIYRVTDVFPKHEMFGLTGQLRRAAASIPSNFVEGFRKRTKPDECLYQLILAHDLHYTDTHSLQADLEQVSRLLQGYINGLQRDAT